MAYSEAQAARVRKALAGQKGLAEKAMFGGLAFLLHGNMCVGVHGEDLIVRVEPSATAALLEEPGARPFTLSGRAGMDGWLVVGGKGIATEAGLRAWVRRGLAYAAALPPKKATRAGGRRRTG